MSAARLSKLAAVALAMLAGFLLGKFSNDEEPTSSQDVTDAQAATADPSGEDITDHGTTAVGASKTSPKSSPLSARLKLERYLATCDLDLFPAMFEKELSDSDERLERILQIWLDRDRDGCVAYVASRPATGPPNVNGHRILLRHYVTAEIARTDPAAAWQIADRIKAHSFAKYTILVDLLEKDPAEALELAEAYPGVMIGSGAFMPIERPGFDPMQALPVIGALHPGGGRNSLASDGLNLYAAHPEKLAEAGEWFEQLPSDAKRFVVRRLERRLSDANKVDETVQKLHEIWKLE